MKSLDVDRAYPLHRTRGEDCQLRVDISVHVTGSFLVGCVVSSGNCKPGFLFLGAGNTGFSHASCVYVCYIPQEPVQGMFP